MINDIDRLSIELTILINWLEAFFDTIFEDVRHERSLLLLLSLTDPDILKQSKFTDHEIDNIKNLAQKKLYRQRNLREIIAFNFLAKQFSD